jgi:serine/threonine-protein kinase
MDHLFATCFTVSSRELTAGQTIAERYRLIALRGTGGMGSVWRALHLPNQRECALKILHRTARNDGAQLNHRFLREARAASSIDSPNAVRVLDYGMHADVPFIAMELLEGETLAARLHGEGRIAPLEASRIIGHIACALECAHEHGIVHRDLKPENVFLAHTGRGTVAKVLDFGIAKLHDEEALARDLTETGALLGTPHYMSPEQIEGARYVDHRADLWSLAVIAFECITGQRPFKGDGLRALFGAICLQPAPVPSSLCSVPRGFDAWFARATQKDPGQRFRSAAALASALQRVCEEELGVTATEDEPELPSALPQAVARPPAAEPPPRGRPRWTAIRWFLASALVVAIAGWLTVRLLEAAPPQRTSPTAIAPRAAVAEGPAVLPHAAASSTPVAGAAPAAPNPFVARSVSGEETRVRANPRPRRPPAPAPPAQRLQRVPDAPRTVGRHQNDARDSKRWDLDAMLRDRK